MGALIALVPLLRRRSESPGKAGRDRPRLGGGVLAAAETLDEQPSEAGDLYRHFQAGLELLESGNPAQAATRLEKARALSPAKTSIREALGRAYFAVGRWIEAEGEFRTVIEAAPTNDYAHYCLAKSLQRQGQHEQARVHLKLARAMRPGDTRYGGAGTHQG
ncbi:MAG TPA: tetratricopeptide repeat protein [Thermoleophilia bacterium]|nr:tetratricopeptide repeat protein [Thermoleophilia bacterium]